MNHINSKAIMTAEQVKRLKPYEEKLAKFTFTPRNIGYISAEDKNVIAAIYREITGTIASCGSCEVTWICKMNVWYQASKKKYETESEAPLVVRKSGQKKSKK